MNYVYAFGGDLVAMGGWTVTINSHQQAGGYLVNVYTPRPQYLEDPCGSV
jgi:hypothetical protein